MVVEMMVVEKMDVCVKSSMHCAIGRRLGKRYSRAVDVEGVTDSWALNLVYF